jgi:VCBS repeat-containing protein
MSAQSLRKWLSSGGPVAVIAAGAVFVFANVAASAPIDGGVSAAAATPITHVCVNKSTGQLFYLASCLKSQTSVPVTSTSPQFKACYLVSNGVTRKVSDSTTCSDKPRTKENTIPKVPADSDSLYFCVDSDGTMHFKGTSEPTCSAGQSAVVIAPHNRPPTAADDSYSLAEDGSLTVPAPGVLTNDSDPDGDAITAQLDTGPAHADSFTLNSDGSFSYTPAANYNGPDSFKYKAKDSHNALSAVATVSITVTPVNDAPVANDDSVSVQEGGTVNGASVLGNDTDVDGDTLVAALVSGPAHASSFVLNPNGSFIYTHDGSETTSDSFTYRALDGQGGVSNIATVTITINPVNDPPVGVADSYSGAIGNTLAVVGTSGSGPHVVLTGNVLTSNDTDEDVPAQPLSAVAETNASTGGGTATISSDGSFTFLPGVGDKNQNDTFTYHVTDGIATSSGTVTVGIANFLVWYVNNALGSNGDGRSSSPLNTLGGVNGAGGSGDADGTGDIVFLYEGSGSYGGGIPLEASQTLLGERAGLLVNGHQLVAAGSTAPVITNASGVGVGLANGVDVQGVDISGTSGDGVNGSAITTATVGTTTPVNISSAGGDGVALSGAASGNISIASPISGSAGHSVSVANRSGGTTAFSGAIADTGTGISLSGNTGATVNLTGGVTASTGANPAFTATGGGTVNLTGTANTLATTTGTALDVEDTTIGASGLNFRSIAADGAARGIVLLSTGSSGGLTVTGTGSAGTGGTITNIAGADLATNGCASLGSTVPAGVGIYLNNTKSPSFSWMSFPGTFGNFGILGYSVNGFTLANSTMTGTYGGNVDQDEDTVHFCTLTGSASITNSTISNGAESNLRVVNASGTLNRLTLQNSTIGLNQNGGGGGTLLEADGGTFNATVLNSTFQGSRGSPFRAVPLAGATMDLVFGSLGNGNTVHNTHGNIESFTQNLNLTAVGTLTFDINSNHFDTAAAMQAQGGVFINAASSTANASGYFRNNTIGNSGVADSGSSGFNPALDVESNGGGDLTIRVDNNRMFQWGSNIAGFLLQAGATSGNPTSVNATVTNNTIAEPGTFAVTNNAQGFQLNNGTNAGENFTTCLRFASNVVDQAGTGAGGDVRLRQRFDTKVQLPGYTGAADGSSGSPTVASYIQGLNPVGPPTVTSVSSTAAGGGFFNTPGGAACALPGF